MKLFLLKQKDYADYDEVAGMVVRSRDEASARALANTNACDEGKIWENDSLTDCEEIMQQGPQKIIIQDTLKG